MAEPGGTGTGGTGGGNPLRADEGRKLVREISLDVSPAEESLREFSDKLKAFEESLTKYSETLIRTTMALSRLVNEMERIELARRALARSHQATAQALEMARRASENHARAMNQHARSVANVARYVDRLSARFTQVGTIAYEFEEATRSYITNIASLFFLPVSVMRGFYQSGLTVIAVFRRLRDDAMAFDRAVISSIFTLSRWAERGGVRGRVAGALRTIPVTYARLTRGIPRRVARAIRGVRAPRITDFLRSVGWARQLNELSQNQREQRRLLSTITGGIGVITGFFSRLLRYVWEILIIQKLGIIARGIGDSLKSFLAGVGGASIASTIAGALSGVASTIASTLSAIASSLAGSVGGARQIGEMIEEQKGMRRLLMTISGGVGIITGFFNRLLRYVWEMLILQKLGAVFGGIGNLIGGALAGVITTKILPVITGALSSISGALSSIGGAIAGFLGTTTGVATAVAGAITIAGKIGEALGVNADVIERASRIIREKAEEAEKHGNAIASAFYNTSVSILDFSKQVWEAGDQAKGWLSTHVPVIGGALGEIAQGFLHGVSLLVSANAMVSNFLGDIATRLGDFAGWLKDNITSFITNAGNALNGFANWVGGQLQNAWGTVKSGIEGFGIWAKAQLEDAWKGFTNTLKTSLDTVIDTVINTLGGIWNKMVGFFGGVVDKLGLGRIGQVLSNASNTVSGAEEAEEHENKIASAFYNASAVILDFSKQIWGAGDQAKQWLSTHIPVIGGALGEIAQGLLHGVSLLVSANAMASDFLGNLSNQLGGLAGWLRDSISSLISNAGNAFSEFANWIGSQLQKAWNTVVNNITGFGNWAQTQLQNAWNNFTNTLKSTLDAVSNTLGGIWDKITGFFKGIADKLGLGGVTQALSNASSSISNAFKGLTDALSGFGKALTGSNPGVITHLEELGTSLKETSNTISGLSLQPGGGDQYSLRVIDLFTELIEEVRMLREEVSKSKPEVNIDIRARENLYLRRR